MDFEDFLRLVSPKGKDNWQKYPRWCDWRMPENLTLKQWSFGYRYAAATAAQDLVETCGYKVFIISFVRNLYKTAKVGDVRSRR